MNSRMFACSETVVSSDSESRKSGFTVGDLKGSLRTGQSIEVLGRSAFTSVSCPATGEVTLVSVIYDDGKTRSDLINTSGGWRHKRAAPSRGNSLGSITSE